MTSDVVLVGGGLANLLIALRLTELRPDVGVTILESGPAIGGNHTWSFHGADLDVATAPWIEPLARATWSETEVRFPGYVRTLPGSYHSITSDRLRSEVEARLGPRIRTGVPVTRLEAGRVELADGTAVSAPTVIDGRGWTARAPIPIGYQTFVGHEVELAAPHGQDRPIIMDATVEQDGGYRFIYTLPYSPETILVEETIYRGSATHDPVAAHKAIERYVGDRGWRIRRVVREERGALPIPLAGTFESLRSTWVPGVPTVGVRAGLFHPITGYSLPAAARVAELIARSPDLTSMALAGPLSALARGSWSRQGFFRLLNRMMFLAAAPESRYRIFERFYRLDPGLIARFYGDRSTFRDRVRLVTGKPPVPFFRGLACLPERVPTSIQ